MGGDIGDLLEGGGTDSFETRQARLASRPDLRHRPGEQRDGDHPEAVLQALDSAKGVGGGVLELTEAFFASRFVVCETLFK
jgi:hypothetical protein